MLARRRDDRTKLGQRGPNLHHSLGAYFNMLLQVITVQWNSSTCLLPNRYETVKRHLH